MDFPGFLFHGDKKVEAWTEKGIHEYRVVHPRAGFHPQAGFYIFRTINDFNARILRPAEFGDREKAFENKATIDVITTLKDDKEKWYCHPAQLNQQYVDAVKFPAPLYFGPEDLSVLQAIEVGVFHRFGRRVLVYKDIQWRYPTKPLDEAQENLEDPKFIPRGRREERDAIRFAMDQHTPTFEKLVGESLRFIGAILKELRDLGNGQHLVGYMFEGKRDSVTINDKLTTLDSGICLSGADRDYDVGSVILVKHRRHGQ